jgi:hypothetical protein
MIVIPCGLSLYTHALHELSCLFEIFYVQEKYLCWSQLSFISLLSFEMLSVCVISGLYMLVLKLTWEKLISVNFPQFFFFQCEASGQSLLASGRVVFSLSGRYFFWSPDKRSLVAWTGIRLRPYACGNQRPDDKDISSRHARPVHVVPRQHESGRH